MTNTKSSALQNAHDLIERGELEAAQEILVPLLESDADDAGVWWVYAHSVRDIGIGQAALRRVLELDPLYPGARELSQDLNRIDAPLLHADPLTANESVSAQNADIDIDNWEDLQTTVSAPQTNQSARIGTNVLVTALLLLIVGGLLIATGAVDINQLLSGILPTPQPAARGEVATAEPGESDTYSIGTAVLQEDITPIATAQSEGQPMTPAPSPTYVPLPSAMDDFVQRVAQQIVDFKLEPRQAFLLDSNAGKALVLQTCALPGDHFNAKVASIMQAVATLADEIPAELDALAAGLLNCDDPVARLRIIGSEVRIIRDFANGEIDDPAFQREWKQLTEAPRGPTVDTGVEASVAAAVATGDLAQTSEPTPTYVPLPKAESDFANLVAQQIVDFKLDPRQALLRDSDAGNTLVLPACALPGSDFNARVAAIMQAVVTQIDKLPAELDAVAAGLLNCDEPGATMRLIGLEVRLIRDFASGAIDERAFQREWKQLG